MAAKKAPAPKRKYGGQPWSSLAKEMVKIGYAEDDSDQTAWAMWFEMRCPQTWVLLKENKDCMTELYEQSTGRFVSTDEPEADDEPPEEPEEK